MVKGVRGVVKINEIDYKTDRSDSRIKKEIERTLEYDVRADHVLIDVEVNDGDVTLSGTVGSLTEKHLATSDAWVTGINSVDNNDLKVERWNINVTVSNGTATLTVTVETELEKQYAEVNALGGGATEVDNDIIVTYTPPEE